MGQSTVLLASRSKIQPLAYIHKDSVVFPISGLSGRWPDDVEQFDGVHSQAGREDSRQVTQSVLASMLFRLSLQWSRILKEILF